MAATSKNPVDLFFTGDIDTDMTKEFQRALRGIHEKEVISRKVRINICSGGGDIELTLAIASQIFHYRRQGRFFITHCSGGAYSGGVTIMQSGNYRTIDKFGTLMTHSPQITLDSWNGSLPQFSAYAEAVKRIGDKSMQIIADRTGHDMHYLREHFFNGDDNYFDAETALDFNLVDEIIDAA